MPEAAVKALSFSRSGASPNRLINVIADRGELY